MAKKSYKDISGTSFYGTTITTTVAELKKIIGEQSKQEINGQRN
tara:strand:+ start:50 stop:181 length:132 start_codon:yes stop_codon:yes gene_type:complete